MIKKLFLLFFAIIWLFSCVDCLCIPRSDVYAGQNIDALIKKFGAPYLDEYKTIPKDISGYAYSTLQVWLKNENDIWIVFSSIKYGKYAKF